MEVAFSLRFALWETNVGNLKTSESLLDALRDAAAKELTAAELRKQRISFIMGTLKDTSTVTREKVTEVLAAQEGKK
jgi:hypothetical protein